MHLKKTVHNLHYQVIFLFKSALYEYLLVCFVPVCKDGETRLSERSNAKLDICSLDQWFTIEKNIQVNTETRQNFSLSLDSASTFVTFIFATVYKIERFDMKCSTFSGSTRHTSQSIFVQPPSNGTFENSLPYLQSSESYECCITLYYETTDVIQVLDLVDQKCELAETKPTTKSGSSNEFFWLIILLGSGMLFALLILVVVVGAWVIYCSKVNRRWGESYFIIGLVTCCVIYCVVSS